MRQDRESRRRWELGKEIGIDRLVAELAVCVGGIGEEQMGQRSMGGRDDAGLHRSGAQDDILEDAEGRGAPSKIRIIEPRQIPGAQPCRQRPWIGAECRIEFVGAHAHPPRQSRRRKLAVPLR